MIILKTSNEKGEIKMSSLIDERHSLKEREKSNEKGETMMADVFDAFTESLKDSRSARTIIKSENDPVNHPSHYNQGKVETIDCIESACSEEGFLFYCLGNVIKYVSRQRNKGGITDLRKAQWYLNKAVDTMDKRGF